MTLLTDQQMRSIQQIGESGMKTTVEIYARQPYAKDPTQPYGDTEVKYAATPVVVLGWLVTKASESPFISADGMNQGLATHQIRVPVGTVTRAGDHVKVGGIEYVIVDETGEQTWPEWTVLYVRGYQDANT